METNPTRKKSFLRPLFIGAVIQALPALFLRSDALCTVCSLLWPLFFLTAFRRADSNRKLVGGAAALLMSKFLRYMFTFGTSLTYMLCTFAFMLLFVLAESAVFILDRRVNRNGVTVLTSLVFPLMYTVLCVFSTLLGSGNIYDPAAVIGNMPVLLQSASAVLEHGLCFFLMWLHSLLAGCIDAPKPRRRVLGILAGLLVIMPLVFGWGRLGVRRSPDMTVRVAMCTSFPESFDAVSSTRTADTFLTLVETELGEAVAQGAELVLFTEEHTCLALKEVPAATERISALVRQYGVPVLLPLEITTPEGEKDINEAILFDRDGTPLVTYVKYNLVPVVETSGYVTGSGELGYATVEIGGQSCKLAVCICFDGSNASYIRTLDRDTDILLCPCWEWFSCNQEQKRNACLRAAENGVTVIKPTHDGYHIVADPYGIPVFTCSTEGAYAAVTVADIPLCLNSAGETTLFAPHFNNTAAASTLAILVTFILLFSMRSQVRNGDAKTRRYMLCLLMTVLALILDTVSYVYDGSRWSTWLATLVNYGTYIFSDLIIIAFVLYIKAIISERSGTQLRSVIAALIIAVADILFLTVGTINGRLFTVVNGAYVPGPWDIYSGYGAVVNMVFLLAVVLSNRKWLDMQELSAIILYMVLPLIAGMLVTVMGAEGSLSYVAVSLSLLIVYVLIQSRTIEEAQVREKLLKELSAVDTLTGLNNRRAFDARMAELTSDEPLAVIFCDLNGLKETNDTYGHAAGDRLLLRFSGILAEHFDKKDTYRISGDEFIIIYDAVAAEKAQKALAAFEQTVRRNDRIAAVGYAAGIARDWHAVIKQAEERMYANKAQFHTDRGEEDARPDTAPGPGTAPEGGTGDSAER